MTPTLEDLFRAVEGTNPFSRNRVSEASSTSDTDERRIHESEFNHVLARVQAVAIERIATGVLVIGGAGVGKSHLLGRLYRWAHDDHATSVFLHNVLASPARLARYVVHATVSTLAGRPASYCESELYKLVNRAISTKRSREKKKTAVAPNEERMKLLSELGRTIDPSDRVMPVLKVFVERAREAVNGDPTAEGIASAAVAWLSGETVEDEMAGKLGILTWGDPGARLEDDDAIRHVFHVLAALSGAGERPFVLCVDQVDNLDEDKVVALASFLQALLDHCKNLAVIVSGVKESMLLFRKNGTIPEAAWDRIAEYKIELSRLGQEEAKLLVRARVEQFIIPFGDLPEVRKIRASGPFFPLTNEWLEKRLNGVVEMRARDVVSWSREAWEEQKALIVGGKGQQWLESWPKTRDRRPISKTPPPPPDEAIDRLVAIKIKERVAERTLQPDALPPDVDNWTTLVSSLLDRCAGRPGYTLASAEAIKKGVYHLRAVEVIPQGREIKNGVLFLASARPTDATLALKRMIEDKEPPDHRYLVSDEERQPIKFGKAGTKGVGHYEALRALGKERFEHVKLTFQDHAELDAFEGVLRTARVGDLEIEDGDQSARPLTEDEVAESMHRQGFLLRHPLLHHLLTEELPPVSTGGGPGRLYEVDRQRGRETVQGKLSWRLGMTTRELAQIYVDEDRPKAAVRINMDHVRLQFVGIVDEMHGEGLLHATPQDDDRFVTLLPKEK
jgi:hypothetical protein